MKEENIICIACPLGCNLQIIRNRSSIIIKGNRCKKGEDYAIREVTNPTRILTTTVKINNSFLNRLPVRTNKPIPKDKIFKCMELINSIEIDAPVKIGDVILKKTLGLNVDVVASRSMKKV